MPHTDPSFDRLRDPGPPSLLAACTRFLVVLLTCAAAAYTHGARAETALERLAEDLGPGEFALLDTAPGQLLSGYREDGSWAPPIDTWTASASSAAPAPGGDTPTDHAESAGNPPSAPVPDGLGATALGSAAENLAPGGFTRLETSLPEDVATFREFLRVTGPDGRSHPIDGWTDAAHWDPQRQRTFFLGIGGSAKLISYDAAANRWEELEWAGEAPPRHDAGEAVYGCTALDPDRGHYYYLHGKTLYRYAVDAQSWRRLDDTPLECPVAIEWHGALEMLVGVDAHTVHAFDGERWRTLGQAGVHGDYASAVYNPVRRELMVLGGKKSPRQVTLLDAHGALRDGPEAPFQHRLSLDNLTYDPDSGTYLVLRRDRRTLWAFDADKLSWRVAQRWSEDAWPFRKYGTTVPVAIDNLGVVLWQSATGPKLFRPSPPGDGVSRANASPAAESSQRGSGPASPTASPLPARTGAPSRPTPPDPAEVRRETTPHQALSAIGETMSPREWRYVETGNQPDFQVDFCPLDDPDSRSTLALGWMDSLAYHEGTQSFWGIGMRDSSEKRLFFLDRNLEWHNTRIPLDECQTDRRPFNRLSLADAGDGPHLYWPSSNDGGSGNRRDRGRMVRAPIASYLEGETDVTWEEYSEGLGIANMNNSGDFAVEWFPEMGGWIFYGLDNAEHNQNPPLFTTDGNQDGAEAVFSQEGHTEEGADLNKQWYGRAMFLKPGGEWTQFDRAYTGRNRPRLVYNPLKGQMLLAPGNVFGDPPEGSNPTDEWAIIHPSGGLSDLGSSPDEAIPWVEKIDRSVGEDVDLPQYATAHSSLTYHPVTGGYLWWSATAKAMYYSPDGKHWQLYEDFSDLGTSRFPDGATSFKGGGGLFGASAMVLMNAVPGTDLVAFFDPYEGIILHRLKEIETTQGTDNSPTLDGTWLKTTADALNPGEWHYGIDASVPEGFTSFGNLVNAGSDAAGATSSSNIYWGPIALWNPDDTRMYMIADRTSGPSELHAVSFFGYDAQNHAFVQYPVVDRSDTDFGSPHVYGRWALDTSRQKFYRMAGGGYSFDIPTDVWTKTGDLSAWDSNGRMSSYFPEIDRVVVMNSNGAIDQWNPDTGTTSTLTTNSIPALATAGNNHGHSVYNETRQEVAFFSNVENGKIGLLDSSGVLTEGATFPYTDQQAKYATSFLFYDPISGHYLVFLRDDGELWEYDPDTDQWALALSFEGTAAEWPTYQGMLITVIQELNAIMWLHKSDHRIYKHAAVL